MCFCKTAIVLPDGEARGERRRGDTSTGGGEAGDAKPLSPYIILTLLPYVSKLCEIYPLFKKAKKSKTESYIITTPALSQWGKKGNSAPHTRGLCSVDKCRSKGARFHGFSWKIETSKMLKKNFISPFPKGMRAKARAHLL